jgi:hypothetical protein
VPPAQPDFQQIPFRTEIIDQPLTLAGHALLGLVGAGLVVGDDDLGVAAELVHGNRFGS